MREEEGGGGGRALALLTTGECVVVGFWREVMFAGFILGFIRKTRYVNDRLLHFWGQRGDLGI